MPDKVTSPPFDFIRGDATGLHIPAHPDAFLAVAPEFLTEAFRAFGSIAPDNRVTRIDLVERCPGGSTGHKLFLTVAYARAEPGLHTELFVKFSRDFTDARRDWQRTEMLGEAKFAPISRLPGFPIRVPTAYFADIHAESSTGIIVTERIFFGHDGIEPHRRKCMDHLTLNDPLPYYRAIVTALARLAAAHKAGRLAHDIEQRFPFDPLTGSTDPIRYSDEELRAEFARCADYAARCPQLLPPEVRSPDFLAQVERDAFRIRQHEQAIRRYLTSNPDLVALCHWNAHIDNCWFRRGEAGELHCGLIDWGRAGQLTFGAVLWGGLCAAPHAIWDHHFGDLLALFADEYHQHGGPLVTPEELEFHLSLHMASQGVARVFAFPETILYRLPKAVHASGPHDPMFETVDPARNMTHIYAVFLKYWHRRDFGAHLDQLLRMAVEPH